VQGANSRDSTRPQAQSREAPNATRNRGVSVAVQKTTVAKLTRERDEALKQQTAASEVLRVIKADVQDRPPGRFPVC
jgi:hypothetical protein